MEVTLKTHLESSGVDLWPDFMPPREAWCKPFWLALSQGNLVLRRCNICHVTRYPPVEEGCANCGEKMIWFQANGTAHLWSWTTFHREFYPAYPLSPPYTVLMVELAEGIRLLASLAQDIKPANLQCDMELELSPLALSSGVFIPAFRPTK